MNAAAAAVNAAAGMRRRRLGGIVRSVRARLGLLEWRRARSRPDNPAAAAARPVRRLLVLPSDATSIVGAKGDEAMIAAAVAFFRAAEPQLAVGVVVLHAGAEAVVRGLGFIPVRCTPGLLSQFTAIADAATAFGADLLLVLGADVMDGYYSVAASMRQLAGGDLVARRQCPAVVLGFSFNDAPSPLLRPMFDGASPNLRLNVRDAVSLQRFARYSRARATLVADVAFLLQARSDDPAAARAIAWGRRERDGGHKVLAFNIHPMLVRDAAAADVQALVAVVVAALDAALAALPLSVLLLSHDDRGAAGDDVCLGPIHRALAPRWGRRIHYDTTPLGAAQVKGVAGAVDAAVVGRMHLAIAALGCGVPVAAFAYQDKFEGLFQHFGLPAGLILAPQRLTADSVRLLIERLLADAGQIAATVRERLPAVLRLARLNLEGRA